MAVLLKGAPVAASLQAKSAEKVMLLREHGVTPTLAIVRIGERPADVAYESGAMKHCAQVGVEVRRYILQQDCGRDDLLGLIQRINADPQIHGCLLFRPMLDKEVEAEACEMLDPAKDVDCITSTSMSNVFMGRPNGFAPCTAQACMELLDYYGYPIKSARVTVIGASLVIGKPVGMLLLNRCATLTMCHIDTINTAEHCRTAEILISAAGCAGLVDNNYVSPNQVILDVGINRDRDGKICGDVAFGEVEPIVKAITPVPGGVGVVTASVLVRHVVDAAMKSCGLTPQENT